MRKVFIVLLIVSALFLVSCSKAYSGKDGTFEDKIENYEISWGTVQSPFSNKCYEVFSYLAPNGYREIPVLSIASEIDCKLLE